MREKLAGLLRSKIMLLGTAALLMQGCSGSEDSQAWDGRMIEFYEHAADSAGCSDWPQWRGPHRNGRGYLANANRLDFSKGSLSEVWSRPLGAGYSALTISGNRLYAAYADNKSEWLACLDSETGEPFWRHKLNARYVEQSGDGPRSTPAVAGQVVYCMGSYGVLRAIDILTGDQLWERDIHKKPMESHDRGHSSSPIVHKGLIILSGGNQPAHTLLAINQEDGSIVWTYENGSGSYSSPVIHKIDGQEQVVCCSQYGLVGLDFSSGKELWSYKWTTEYGLNITTPLLFAGSHVFLSSGYNKGASMVKITKSDTVWKAELLWSNNEFRNHFNSSVSHEGYIYGFDNGLLKCINALTGQMQWQVRGYNKGSLIIAGKILVVLGERGNLALVEATPEAFSEITSIQALDGKCWTSPSLAKGKIFVRNQQELKCFRLAGT